MSKIRYYLSALALLVAPQISTRPATALTQQPSTKTTTTTACADLHFIFARGSGSGLGATDAQAWQSALELELERLNSTRSTPLTSTFYELGSAPQSGAQYPAAAVSDSAQGYLNALGALVSAGNAGDFGASVRAGQQEIINYIANVSSTCPETKFVLGGYSQGAMVVSGALPSLNPDQILYAATFGDPKLYLPEGKGTPAAACLGITPLSNYRINVPDCAAYEGILGSYRPYQPAGYTGKLGTWCNRRDVMCSSGWNLDDHMVYASENWYADAATKISSAIADTFPPAATSAHDVAILIDTSVSMSFHIDEVKAQIVQLATEIYPAGGRIAIYAYRDLIDPFEPVPFCDFTCSEDDIARQLKRIYTGGGGDEPESTLSATALALDQLAWRPEAEKSLIIFSDAPYLSPDRDGTTVANVLSRLEKVGAVKIHAYTMAEYVEDYDDLTTATGGKTRLLDEQLSTLTSTVLSSSIPARASKSSARTAAKTTTATTSALLNFQSDLNPAKITQLSTTNLSDTAVEINFSAQNAERAIVILDGAILGYLDGVTSLTISDLTHAATLELVPYNSLGNRGERQTIILAPTLPTAPNAGTTTNIL